MKIENNFIDRSTIEAFAEQHNLTMVVRERRKSSYCAGPWSEDVRYYASFRDCDIAEGGMIKGSFGNGSSPEKAIIDYANEISGALLVIDSLGKNRKDIRVPILEEQP
jgi:hypothetical protein